MSVRPEVRVTGKDRDTVHLVDKLENKIVNLLWKKHDLGKQVIVKLLSGGSGEAYVDLEKMHVVLDTAGDSFKRAVAKGVLEGLLAHETAHLVQKREGTDDRINMLVVAAVKNNMKRVRKLCAALGEPEEKVCKSLVPVLLTLGLVLKDINADDLLIKEGFGPQLFNYYMSTIALREKREKMQVEELSFEDANNLFLAVIDLTPAWVPFLKGNMKEEGALIKKEIYERFSDIPIELRTAANKITSHMMSMKTLSQGDVDELLSQVLDAYESVLEKKPRKR